MTPSLPWKCSTHCARRARSRSVAQPPANRQARRVPAVTVNPSLQDVGFCPRCAAPATVDYPRSLRCPSCGYAAFYNPKPVACAIAREPDGRIWLARRGHEPGRGRWSMPGGFVDLGESVEGAIARELGEELCVEADIGALLGVYSR